VPTLQAFCSTAESRLSALTAAQTEMNERLGATARHFGENPQTINSHELFSTFDAFFQSLDEARHENQRRIAAAKEAEKQIRITRERKERISTASKKRKFKFF
jgi:hypothetical protein